MPEAAAEWLAMVDDWPGVRSRLMRRVDGWTGEVSVQEPQLG
jgi:hypothetical protein